MSKRYLTSPRALLLAGSALLALPTAAQAQDQEQVAADANAPTQAAEPASTVDTGEIVVTAGVQTLHPGQKVRLLGGTL